MSQNTSNAGNGIFISGLTLLFIYLKMTSQLDWSWLWVLSPIWITACVCLVAVLIGAVWAIWES